MIALVTSSATKRISTASGAPSPETPGNGISPPAGRAAVGRSADEEGKSGGGTVDDGIRPGEDPVRPEILAAPGGACWVPVMAGAGWPRGARGSRAGAGLGGL